MRIWNSSSNGSKCTSLAWSLIAWSSTMLTSLRIGAASAISSGSERSKASRIVPPSTSIAPITSSMLSGRSA